MVENNLLKSYKLHFESNNFRKLTKSKATKITDFSFLYKKLTNFISREHHNWISRWKKMSKDDRTFVRKIYEKEFQREHGLKSQYAQNIYQNADSKYSETIKSFFSKAVKSDKKWFKKPYQEECKSFPLDNRMVKDFIKDKVHKDLYWLAISDFKKDSRWFINIPVMVYDEVSQMLKKWYKYTFAVHKDFIEIIFKVNIVKVEKDLKDAKKIAIDFGKFTSTFDWKNTKQYDLSKFYRKVKKLQYQIKTYQSQLDIMKNNKSFWPDYDLLKLDIKRLFMRIKNIRKHSYNFILNDIMKDNDIIIVEDLSFEAIRKDSKKYKWRWFNKFINVMWRWVWNSLLEYKAKTVGNRLVYVPCENTSRECNDCWFIHKLNRNWRFFKCRDCWYCNDSDINASMIIFKRWTSILILK